MSYIHESIITKIEQLKNNWEYDEALKIVNNILVSDPSNDDALLQIADIQYMKGEISKAEKPIDYILSKSQNDPIWYYVKWVLEMEKTNWNQAKKYLRKALELWDINNPEITRCYGLSEYWSWNREKWIDFLVKAFNSNKYDCEIIYNLIEIYLLEHKYSFAQKMIKHYQTNKSKLEAFGREIEFYNQKIKAFDEYIKNLKQKKFI